MCCVTYAVRKGYDYEKNNDFYIYNINIAYGL